jgi:hypothetical protein
MLKVEFDLFYVVVFVKAHHISSCELVTFVVLKAQLVVRTLEAAIVTPIDANANMIDAEAFDEVDES